MNKNFARRTRMALFSTIALSSVLSTGAFAQTQTAIFFTPGGWVQTTTGQGHDHVYYLIDTVVYRADGSWKLHWASTFDAGDHNDKRGPGAQELGAGELSRVDLEPGERAEIEVMPMGVSDGGLWGIVSAPLKKVLMGGLTSGDALTTALSAGGYAAALYVDSLAKGTSGYMGSLRASTQNEGGPHWQFVPGTNAWFRGPDVGGSYSVGMNNGRGEYWLKIAMRFEPKSSKSNTVAKFTWKPPR